MKVKFKYKYTRSQWFLFFAIVSNGIGNLFTICGLKPSILFSLLLILFTILEKVKNKSLKINWESNQKYFCLFVIGWFFYSIIQFLWVKDISYFKIGIGQLWINIFLIVMLIIHVNSIKDIIFYLKSLIAVLIFQVMLGSYEIITGRHWVKTESIWDEKFVRTLSTNPNESATLMYCVLLGFILYICIKNKNTIWEYILLILSVITIFCTGSRGVQLGIIILASMFCLNYILIKFINHNKIKMLWFINFSFVFLLLLTIFSFININNLISVLSGDSTRASDIYRLRLIIESLKVWVNTFGFGSGPLQTTYLIKMNPHNFIIEMLADYGFLITSGIIIILWKIMKEANRPIYSVKVNSLLISAVPSFLVAGISSSSINKFRVYWVIITLLYLTPIYLRKEKLNVK